jgi:hypothetical protein
MHSLPDELCSFPSSQQSPPSDQEKLVCAQTQVKNRCSIFLKRPVSSTLPSAPPHQTSSPSSDYPGDTRTPVTDCASGNPSSRSFTQSGAEQEQRENAYFFDLMGSLPDELCSFPSIQQSTPSDQEKVVRAQTQVKPLDSVLLRGLLAAGSSSQTQVESVYLFWLRRQLFPHLFTDAERVEIRHTVCAMAYDISASKRMTLPAFCKVNTLTRSSLYNRFKPMGTLSTLLPSEQMKNSFSKFFGCDYEDIKKFVGDVDQFVAIDGTADVEKLGARLFEVSPLSSVWLKIEQNQLLIGGWFNGSVDVVL